MKRFLVALCLVVFLPLLTSAYTLVLKDGRRIEVREQYRIVKDIAVFTLADNTRFSLSLEKINIEETELANGLTAGLFLKNTSTPPKETDSTTNSSNKEDNPIVTSRATAHKITNSDFDKYRIRREETNKDAAERAAAKAASNPVVNNPLANPALITGVVANPAIPPSPQAIAQTAFDADLAQYREEQKNKEIYWRTRARTLLTQMRVEEEQLAMLRSQLENTRQQPTSSSVSVYTPPPVYPYPGVTIGRIPIGIGGPRSTGGAGNVIVVNNQNQTNLTASLQDKIIQLELQHQATLIMYDEMREDARHDGALPGWLR